MGDKPIELGLMVLDVITGFVGTAVSVTTYLDGTTRFGVQPVVGEDNKMPDIEYIDVQRLVSAEDILGNQPDADEVE